METLGRPFVLQNTKTHGWIVRWDNAIEVTTEAGELIESVSFTVAIPRQATLTIEETQQFALMRAAELLQKMIHRAG